MAKVKGMFFTLGLTLLATVLFSLAILIVNNAEVSKEATTSFVIADRLYELDSSIQNNFAEILKDKAGISITGTTFQESLPNPNYLIFNDSMYDYKSYIETNYDNIALNISRITDEIPINVPRYGITYYHDFNQNKIKVNHTGSTIQGYRIEVVGATSCTVDDYTLGSMTLNIPSCFNNQVNTAQITIGSVSISLTSNELQITNNGAASLIETELLVPDNQVAMYFPGNVINIDFLEFGIQKRGLARIM